MDNKKIIIIGAGGYAVVVAETALLAGFQIVGFADDNLPLCPKIFKNLTVVSTISDIDKNNSITFDYFIVAIGNNKIRKQIYQKLSKHFSTTNITHPNAFLSQLVEIKLGNVILAGAVINANSKIGENNIINSLVLIDHDTTIASHCHLSQGSVLGSNVIIEDEYLTEIGQIIPSFSHLA